MLTPLNIGRRYQLYETLGRGGMGVVYRARDLLTGHPVALKQVTVPGEHLAFSSRDEGADLVFSLAQEFRALATLRHPHIISVYDFGFDQQRQPYFTMEYLDGSQTILEAGRALPINEKIGLVNQVLQALVYLHRRGILHRDLKPANALVLEGHLKLLDFGLSVITGRNMEHLTQTTAGTMAYLAPEIFQGEPYSQASDLYAVGMIALQLFTGQFPYNDSNMATLLNDILNRPVDASALGLDGALTQVLNRLLTKNRKARYGDAAEVIAELSAATGLPQPPETEEIRESFLQAAEFVGREPEMVRLTQALKMTADGRGATIVVAGESGVGKSRLLDELRIRAMVEGVLVLGGQAISVGRSPYQLWRDVLHALALYSDPNDEELATLKAVLPDIEGLLNRDVSVGPGLSSQAGREPLSWTISRLLNRLEQPVLIILEDLHWAGDESIDLLINLSYTVTKRAVMLAGTIRDESATTFGDALAPEAVIHLNRFTDDDISELSQSMLGPTGSDPEIIQLLERETEGNAFFLVEAVRSLAEQAGRLDRIGAIPLPDDSLMTGGIQAILEYRLNRVPEEARPMMRLASVAGRVLDLTLLRFLEPEVDFGSWLATCTGVAVLEPYGDTWRFAHDKLREAIAESLGHDLHHDLHRRVAEGLEALYPDAPEHTAILAHHWLVAGDPEKQLHYVMRAGYQAAKNNSNVEAIHYFERALTLLQARQELE